jgi:hypothetical protein
MSFIVTKVVAIFTIIYLSGISMKKYSFFIIVIILSVIISRTEAQVIGKLFPNMETSTADGKKVNLPIDTHGKFTLLGMAFSKKSEDELNTWIEPVFWKFINKPDGKMDQLFGNQSYDVNAYFVPMFTGIKTAATGTAKKQALKKMDPRLIPSILFYQGKLEPYKDALDFQKKDIPYFFVLDKDGKIIYATSGIYTEEKMNEVEELLTE